jgi:predicted RNA binding protein YcfA (HicA-like mRNA interferase family)
MDLTPESSTGAQFIAPVDPEHAACFELLMDAYFLPPQERREHEETVAELLGDTELFLQLRTDVDRILKGDLPAPGNDELVPSLDSEMGRAPCEARGRLGAMIGSMNATQFIRAMGGLGFVADNDRSLSNGDHVHLVHQESGDRTYVSLRNRNMSRGVIMDLLERANVTPIQFLQAQGKIRT